MATTELYNNWELKPFIVDGDIQLVDMYTKEGEWHGSRRTIKQCKEYIDQHHK